MRREAYAELYGKVERRLFAATETGIDALDLKQEYQLGFGITARHCARAQIWAQICSMP
jgi:hypothetical protein